MRLWSPPMTVTATAAARELVQQYFQQAYSKANARRAGEDAGR
jgi:hypothetical protein